MSYLALCFLMLNLGHAQDGRSCLGPKTCEDFFECCRQECNGQMDYRSVRCTEPEIIDMWNLAPNKCICLETAENGLNLTSFRQEGLQRHNVLRQLHGVQLLELTDDLNESAQKWAETMVRENIFEHSPEATENLAQTLPWETQGWEGVQAWYDEIRTYNHSYPDESQGVVGHYQNLIWKSAAYLGLGAVQGPNYNIWVVAQYENGPCPSGPGHWDCVIGQYNVVKNVLPPLEGSLGSDNLTLT